MERNKNNKKWIIFGFVIFVLAVLVAVGPILFTKYMRNKWQNAPKYKTSNILINVVGTLKKSSQNEVYLAGENKLFYIIEDISEEDLNSNLDKKISVTGKMKMPKGDVTVDGNPVRLYISVEKIDIPGQVSTEVDKDKLNAVVESEREKTLKKNKIRIMVNAVLDKSILFDVTRGTLTLESRKTIKGDKTKEIAVLIDEFGDRVILVGKDKIKNFVNNKIVCLGRELPSTDVPISAGETIFEIYEVYDADYKKLL